MKIEKISKQKNGKYKIILDSGEDIITYDEVILKYQLLFKKEISSELQKKIEEETAYYSFYDKALKMIQKRIRSKKEIVEYLEKNEVSKNDIASIVLDLEKKGFLHDERFCEAYISDKLYLSSVGPLKIMKDLMNHNIDEAIIRRNMERIDDSVFYDRLFKQMMKKVKGNHKYSRSILRQKLISYYMEEGYSKELIVQIFDEIYQDDPAILQKEADKLRKKLSKKYEGKELDYQLLCKLYQKGFLKEQIDQIKEES